MSIIEIKINIKNSLEFGAARLSSSFLFVAI